MNWNPLKWFSWNKTRLYLMTKLELSNISDTEREIIKKHRSDLAEAQVAQAKMKDYTNQFFLNIETSTEEKAIFFYDFVKEWANSGQNVAAPSRDRILHMTDQATGNHVILSTEPITPEALAAPIVVKPKDVFDELERVPDLMSMENIDQKVQVLEMKKDLIKHGNTYAKKEVIDMQLRLLNRKKYEGEVKEFYDQYENTTIEKVMNLVNKYRLVLKTSDLFIPTFPDEAILIMKKYTEATVALCGKYPVYYVIAEAELFKKEYQRNDPILLVQSPFGNYFQILGAWDKEMILLEEL